MKCGASATTICVYESGHDGPCSYNVSVEIEQLRAALGTVLMQAKLGHDHSMMGVSLSALDHAQGTFAHIRDTAERALGSSKSTHH